MNKNFFKDNMILLISIVLIIIAVFLTIRVIKDRTVCTKEVSAIVVENIREEKYSNGKRRIYYYPVFNYTVDGKEYTQKRNSGGDLEYEVGEKVTLKVEPGYPQNFIVKGDNSLLIVAVIEGAFGLLLGFSDVRSRIRKKRFLESRMQ